MRRRKTTTPTRYRMELKMLPLAKLKPWKENPRQNASAVEAVRKSIQSFGFNVPIICDNKLRILAGHTRRKAAQRLGMKQVPVVMVAINNSLCEAFAVADNQTALIADWDMEHLTRILKRLQTSTKNLDALGFSPQQLEALLAPGKEFPWEQFKCENDMEVDKPYILLPVKLPREMAGKIKKAIKLFASRSGIRNRDNAILAGEVLIAALGGWAEP